MINATAEEQCRVARVVSVTQSDLTVSEEFKETSHKSDFSNAHSSVVQRYQFKELCHESVWLSLCPAISYDRSNIGVEDWYTRIELRMN